MTSFSPVEFVRTTATMPAYALASWHRTDASTTVSETTSTSRSVDALLRRQEGFIDDLARLVHGRSPRTLTRPDHDGRWSVVEIVSHLYDWERITHDRVHRILTEDTPRLPAFDDSLWAIEHGYRTNDMRIVLGELRRHREMLVGRLRTLPATAWMRTGRLEHVGPISLFDLIERMTAHDAKHLAQARDILS